LRPENGLTEAKKISSNPSFPTENLFRIKKSTALALSMQNHAPAQGFPKGSLDKMFGWMLPRSSHSLPLSKMQMAGIGPKMIRAVMKSRGVKSLEQLMKEAGEFGVRIHVCEMSMGVMGLKEEEMIDYPGIDYAGVGSFIQMISESKQVVFL
jgi:peroxiredoxin family protein